MIEVTITELLEFHERKDGEYAPAVKLKFLRALIAENAAYKRECERLATAIAAARSRVA